MKFFAIVCALVTACIYISEAMWHKRLMSYEATKIDCEGRGPELAKQMLEVKCKPRPTLVPLTPQLGYVFHPDYVFVNRCGGYCPNKSCMPVENEMINATIKQMEKYVSGLQCYHVAIEQHTKCKCKCMVKESDCNTRQNYDESNCECVCERRGECKRNMSWNEKSCECTCNKQEEICSTGLVWVPAMCGCAKVQMMPSSSSDNSL